MVDVQTKQRPIPSWLIPLDQQQPINADTYWGKVYRVAHLHGKAIKFRVEFFDDVAHRLHSHPNHWEFVTVIAGALEQTIEGVTTILYEGESASIQRGQPHAAMPLRPGTVVLVELIGEGDEYESVELT